MITPERIRQMEDNFWAETNDPSTEEWREDLTNEELAMVARWDDHIDAALGRMTANTLALCKSSIPIVSIIPQSEVIFHVPKDAQCHPEGADQ